MTEALREVAELVRRESGIRVKESQLGALGAAVRRAASGLDPAAFLRLAADPLEGPAAMVRLIDEVTIKETSFFRDRRQLEGIAWRLLLERARAAGSAAVRAWAPGCATGEEPFTLAILACEAFPPEPPVSILATDISVEALSWAQGGRYRARSIRGLEPAVRARYFEQDGDALRVGERLRRLVRFERHNLVRDPVPPLGEAPFDLIVCRNILIYFDGETVEAVIRSLERALTPHGTLLLGAADALCSTGQRLAALAAGHPPWRRRAAPARRRPLRRPLRPAPVESPAELLARALRAADEERRGEAIALATQLLADDPLNVDAYFVRGLVELNAGDGAAAVDSLRRALYVEPTFGLAAFELGRAHDALGDLAAARRAYEQALRTLRPEEGHHQPILEQVDLGDIAAACRARLAALGRSAGEASA